VHPATIVLLRNGTEVTRWTLHGRADLATVDRLARLQLSAKRLGCRIVLDEPCPQLAALLDVVGLGVEMER
jgi:hypothetical protein